ncbi:MAG: hypothetical protein QME68_07825 [Elusimicrobiota bacterium]|nr:hypothetical protein [Elusimicrobiota bacterium]
MHYLITIKLNSLRNTFRKFTTFSFVKFSFGIIIALSFLAFLYYGFYRVLIYVHQLPMIGSILLFKFLAIAFLTAFIMVILSSIIVSLSTFYFSTDLNFLLTLPIAQWKIFSIKTVETLIASSWMIFITLIPFIFAFAKVKNVSTSFFGAFLAMSLPFFFCAVAVGIFITMAIMYFFPGSKTRDFILLLFIFLGATVYVIFRFVEPEKLANPDAFNTALAYVAYLNAPVAKFLPSWWFTEILSSIITKNTKLLISNSVLLITISGTIFLILLALSNKFYYRILTSMQYGSKRKKIPAQERELKNSHFGLIRKDIKTFLRDTRQWSQVVLVIALILVYLFSIYRLPKSLSGTQLPASYIYNFLSFLNIGAAGFIIAALALRFAFTQVSLEKGTLWFVLSVPVKIEWFVFRKLFLAGVIMSVISITIAVFSNILLNVSSGLVFWFSTLTIVLVSFGITSLAFGLGAIYPKFDTDNIAQIETSYGGIFFIITALLYIGLTLAIAATPMQMFIKHEFGGELSPKKLLLHGVDLLLLNFIAISLPVWRGIKSLKNYELREWSY